MQCSKSGWAVAAVLALLLVGGVMYMVGRSSAPGAPGDGANVAAAPTRPDTPAITPPEGQGAANADAPDAGTEKPEPAVAPEPAEDPVAEATVVLENYLAADLGHDGKEMAKYLGGQAAARFRPEVQGQEDLTVHSKTVSGHTVRDDNTIEFDVTVEWSAEDSSEVQTDVQQYLLKRTEKGWKIVSTPEYS